MITENLSTLKIYRLTQDQYEKRLESGNIDENALYLTPEEAIDLTPYATKDEVKNKADLEHSHTIDEIGGLQSVLDSKSDSTHNHDAKYDVKGSANNALSTAKSYADTVANNAANRVKNDLLNNAGAAYDTLKELGDLIDDNADAINTLETVATSKQDKITGAATTIVSNDLTASKVLVSDSNGKVSISDISSDKLLHLSEVSSDIQVQLNSKADLSHTHNDIYYTETEINEKIFAKPLKLLKIAK